MICIHRGWLERTVAGQQVVVAQTGEVVKVVREDFLWAVRTVVSRYQRDLRGAVADSCGYVDTHPTAPLLSVARLSCIDL